MYRSLSNVVVNGTDRVLDTTTDVSGNYSVTFQPLPDETGIYSISASFPGAPVGASQAEFTIVGLTATPANIASLSVVPGTPLTGQITLTNLDSTVLTGITATVSGGPAGLTAQLTPPSTLTALGEGTLSYSLTATATGGGARERSRSTSLPLKGQSFKYPST